MNDETLVALRNLARARSLETAARGELQEARDRYRHIEGEHQDRVADLHDAERAFRSAIDADRGLLAEAVLGAGTGDNLPLRDTDLGPVFPSLQTKELLQVAREAADYMAKAQSQTCQVGWPARDCRKPSGHNGQHTWEVTAEELAEAEEARSADATAALVNEAEANMRNALGRSLVDGDPLTVHHHPFIPGPDGRCEVQVNLRTFGTMEGEPFGAFDACGKDPNAPVHLLYAGDGNTRVDYTPTPKGTD